jgi:hypothetical protein
MGSLQFSAIKPAGDLAVRLVFHAALHAQIMFVLVGEAVGVHRAFLSPQRQCNWGYSLLAHASRSAAAVAHDARVAG